MKRTKSNVFSKLLILLLCIALVLAGCGGSQSPSETSTNEASESSASESETSAPAESISELTVSGLGIMHEEEFGGIYLDITIEDFNALGFSYGDSVDILFSNGYSAENLPYYNGYYTKTGEALVVAYPGYPYVKACINNGEDLWVLSGVSEEDTATISLVKQGAYLETQEARDIHYEDDRALFDSDEEFANFRNVTVGAIQEGMLYRSASPCDNQHNRAPYVDALMADAGVKCIVDLADNEEKIQGYLAGSDFNSPYFLSLYEEGNVLPFALNMNFASEDTQAKIAAGLAAMANHDGPYLVHCTEGKDRTGFIMMMLEALCGATYEEIVDDYMITYDNYYGITKENDPKKYDILVEELLNPLIETMSGQEGINPADADLASYAKQYLLNAGMTEEAIEHLKARLTGEEAGDTYAEAFSLWEEDAPAMHALVEYVESVTDESSPDYIPEYDRIAVFDMDGTLIGELYPTYLEYYMLAWRILKDPTIQPDAAMLEVGRTLRDSALDNSFPEDMPMQHAIQAARAYAGMTLPEFEDFVTEILLREVDGFEGMTYGESFYLPMVELVEYLQDNGFTCYICSGSDRFICRVFIEGMLDIPYENVIGMDVALEATGQGDIDGLDYVYTTADDVIRTDQLLIKNLKTNKVLQIAQEIGRQPVLSFGNSSGDVSMHNYTISNNTYRSAAFMLIADDEVRDYGNAEKAADLREKWEANGYEVISMANDWKTIYGEDVVKTGTFRWMEELAEDRIPAE